MMRRLAPLLLVLTSACHEEVPLELGGEGRTNPPGAALGPLAWSELPGGEDESQLLDMTWTADGGLLAAIVLYGPDPQSPDFERTTLVRYDADGNRQWVVEEPDGLGPLSVTPDGGVVAAHQLYGWLGDLPTPVGLDWFAADGQLTRSWRLLPSDGIGDLREVHAVQATPDGGAVWSGTTVDDFYRVAVAGRVDGAGQLLWAVPVQPSEPAAVEPSQIVATPDGAVVVLVSQSSGGDEGPVLDASYLVGLDPDGGEAWRVLLTGCTPRSLDLTPSGGLVVSGIFFGSLSAGDVLLEGEDDVQQPFLVEIAPDGEVLAGRTFDAPPAPGDPTAYTYAARYGADRLSAAGIHLGRDDDGEPDSDGMWIADYDVNGTLLGQSLLRLSGSGLHAGPSHLSVGPAGRRVLGGTFRGLIDLGDGEVSSGAGSPSRAFIAVYDPQGVD